MASCEGAGLDYLFKLRLTQGARRLAERLMGRDEWEDAGQGWSGIEAELRLQGWSRTRRVVVLRRRLPGTVALTRVDDGQGDLFWADAPPGTKVWEFAVLATSLDLEVRSVAQLYRDRADAENGFDELKNQWGLGRLHDAGPEALPAHGPSDRAHLQLVEPVRALGRSRSPPRGDHQPAASAARDCPPDPACRSDAVDGDVEPRASAGGGRGIAAHHRLLPEPDAKCGAVERRGSLAPHPGASAEEVPAWPPARPTALAAAASTRARGLKSTPKTRRPQPATAGSRIKRVGRGGQGEVGAAQPAVSSQIVTGPSLTRWTCISCPKRPVCDRYPVLGEGGCEELVEAPRPRPAGRHRRSPAGCRGSYRRQG